MSMGGDNGDGEVLAGFAKLQGEDFEYYMQTYSISLGRQNEKSVVDVDLSLLGGGMNISDSHVRIFYDFPRRCFALEVIGKSGCLVKGVLHLPGNPHVKLDSQDLLQIGDKKFYFLLPTRSIFAAATVPRLDYNGGGAYDEDMDVVPVVGGPFGRLVMTGKNVRSVAEEVEGYGVPPAMLVTLDLLGQLDKRSETRPRIDREADNHQLLLLEEKDVVSCVATVLYDLCGLGEWMPMAKLHAELLEVYGNVWHHSRVRKYLQSEDWPANEAKGRPWFGLLTLLRKYPEHFVINTRSKGRVTSEFVSLVSLL